MTTTVNPIVSEGLVEGRTPFEEGAPEGETIQEQGQLEGQQAEQKPAEEEHNWRQEAEEARARLREMERQVQRLSSIAGNTRRQAETDALLSRLVAMQEAIVEHLSEAEPDPGKLKVRQQEIAQRQAGDLAKTRSAQIKQGFLDSIRTMLKGVGMNADDQRLDLAISLWNEGVAASDDTMKFLEAHNEVARVVNEAHRENGRKEGATERQRRSQAEGALRPGSGATPRSAAPTASPENIDKLYMDWELEHSNQPNPYEEQYRKMVRAL